MMLIRAHNLRRCNAYWRAGHDGHLRDHNATGLSLLTLYDTLLTVIAGVFLLHDLPTRQSWDKIFCSSAMSITRVHHSNVFRSPRWG